MYHGEERHHWLAWRTLNHLRLVCTHAELHGKRATARSVVRPPNVLSFSCGEAPRAGGQSGAPAGKRRDAVRLARKEGLQPRARQEARHLLRCVVSRRSVHTHPRYVASEKASCGQHQTKIITAETGYGSSRGRNKVPVAEPRPRGKLRVARSGRKLTVLACVPYGKMTACSVSNVIRPTAPLPKRWATVSPCSPP